MDWTGGVRKRFAAGKNNAHTLKQKQHFAKARAALQHAPSSHHTFKPAYLDYRAGDIINEAVVVNTGDEEPDAACHRHPKYDHEEPRSSRHSRRRRDRETSKRDCDSSPHTPRLGATRGSQRHRNHDYKPHRVEVTKRDDANDDELRLLAIRHNLFARGDWLGLSFARPLRMDYASSTDRARIGKRRKVEKSSRDRRPPSRRLPTPLFEERQMRPDYIMSGALPDEEIVVKIGKEAFASQTQPSRHTWTPVATSMRPPSTDMASLSEESMLLGAEGDDLEACTNISTNDVHPHMNDEALLAAETTVAPQQLVANAAQMCPSHAYGQIMNEPDDRAHATDMFGTQMSDHDSEPDSSMIKVSSPDLELEKGGRAFHATPLDALIAAPVTQHVNDQRERSSQPDNKQGRQMSPSAPCASSHTSLAAVKSSNDHLAEDHSSHRPSLRHTISQDIATGRTERQDDFHSRPVDADASREITRNEIEPSPLQQLSEHSTSWSEDAEDEAFWKHLIIGSEGSSDLLMGVVDKAKPRPDSDIVLATNASSSLATSGLGTSITATAGGTLFITGGTSSQAEHADTMWTEIPRLPQMREQLSAEATPKTGRAISEHDSIEDMPPSPGRAKEQINIHATSHRMVNPRHYSRKRSAKDAGQPTKRDMNRVLASEKTQNKRMREDHETYDLLDSDGKSFA